jgi:hypothetical protein
MVGLADLVVGASDEPADLVADRVRAILASGDVRARVRGAIAGAGSDWDRIVPRVRAIARTG